MASLLLMEVSGLAIGFEHKALVIFFIFVATYCFGTNGGILAALLGWSIHTIQIGHFHPFLLLAYIFIGICVGVFEKHRQNTMIKQSHWHSIIIRNAKRLHVFREVSMAMQETHELDRILKIIATSVTAGHGFGFNRSIILLSDENQSIMHGAIGVGPMNPEEGFKIWENILNNKYNLTELIEIQEEDAALDSKLNEHVEALQINLDQDCLITQVLDSGEPLHIQMNHKKDATQQLLADIFHMNEFVVFPLINRGSKVGVLIIDNIVNQKEITPEDIDSVIPIANQAAIAIQQAHLYEQIEDMALKDGLTGLMNQRSFQKELEKLFSNDDNQKLACIMIDIDFFKHYNDTNGHLQGNNVLVQTADVIRDSIRLQDYSFRFGGEEFVVLLPNTVLHDASIIAEQIRRNVEHTIFPYDKYQPNGTLTISLGVASTEQLPQQTINHLIEAADHALYQAKDSGRNKVEIFKELKVHG